MPPNCARVTIRFATRKDTPQHLGYAFAQLLHEMAQDWAAFSCRDAVGLVDGKHYRFSLIYGNLHESEVLLSNNALQAHAQSQLFMPRHPNRKAI
jgi:hypothetical protein